MYILQLYQNDHIRIKKIVLLNHLKIWVLPKEASMIADPPSLSPEQTKYQGHPGRLHPTPIKSHGVPIESARFMAIFSRRIS